MAQITKGFIKNWSGDTLLPITRAELVLDLYGNMALNSEEFLAKDGHPGLITAAERAMLTGGGNGHNLSDVYTKLDYINKGILVNGSTLSFYNTASTPIKIISDGENKIAINVNTDSNLIHFGLDKLTETNTIASLIIKNITIDKYGRVISVLGEALTNEEIPETLSGKLIQNSRLDSCVTENKEIGSDEKSIVNKYYVDLKILEVSGLATGALKFGGPVSDTVEALGLLTSTNPNYNNHYFKVTKDFELSSDYLVVDTVTTNQYNGYVKVGDTLIVYTAPGDTAKFVHIPSGDDVTRITVKEQGSDAVINEAIGRVTFQFSPVFEVANEGLIATISIPQATQATDGYLSKSDYIKFSSYAEDLSVTYNSLIDESALGVYSLGTIKVGSIEHTIYGINNISELSLNAGSENNYNPILTFKELGVADVNIAYVGNNGIQVYKNGNNIEFSVSIESTDETYLKAEGNKLTVQLGSIEEDTIKDGLMDFRTGISYITNYTNRFEIITESLKGAASTTEYRYGNQKLRDAVTVTI